MHIKWDEEEYAGHVSCGFSSCSGKYGGHMNWLPHPTILMDHGYF